jgi:hypothetical protein
MAALARRTATCTRLEIINKNTKQFSGTSKFALLPKQTFASTRLARVETTKHGTISADNTTLPKKTTSRPHVE